MSICSVVEGKVPFVNLLFDASPGKIQQMSESYRTHLELNADQIKEENSESRAQRDKELNGGPSKEKLWKNYSANLSKIEQSFNEILDIKDKIQTEIDIFYHDREIEDNLFIINTQQKMIEYEKTLSELGKSLTPQQLDAFWYSRPEIILDTLQELVPAEALWIQHYANLSSVEIDYLVALSKKAETRTANEIMVWEAGLNPFETEIQLAWESREKELSKQLQEINSAEVLWEEYEAAKSGDIGLLNQPELWVEHELAKRKREERRFVCRNESCIKRPDKHTMHDKCSVRTSKGPIKSIGRHFDLDEIENSMDIRDIAEEIMVNLAEIENSNDLVKIAEKAVSYGSIRNRFIIANTSNRQSYAIYPRGIVEVDPKTYQVVTYNYPGLERAMNGSKPRNPEYDSNGNSDEYVRNRLRNLSNKKYNWTTGEGKWRRKLLKSSKSDFVPNEIPFIKDGGPRNGHGYYDHAKGPIRGDQSNGYNGRPAIPIQPFPKPGPLAGNTGRF